MFKGALDCAPTIDLDGGVAHIASSELVGDLNKEVRAGDEVSFSVQTKDVFGSNINVGGQRFNIDAVGMADAAEVISLE